MGLELSGNFALGDRGWGKYNVFFYNFEQVTK